MEYLVIRQNGTDFCLGLFTPATEYNYSCIRMSDPNDEAWDTKYRKLVKVEELREVHPPQPSEQAKGAEPSNMAKRLTNKLWLSHLGMDVIRNYALEIDAAFESQHKAEMEAVKKGASR